MNPAPPVTRARIAGILGRDPAAPRRRVEPRVAFRVQPDAHVKRLTLLTATLGSSVFVLDGMVVNVALPAIR